MKHQKNIEDILLLDPFMMGFIYYKKSSRYIEYIPSGIDFKSTLKVGVFVDEDIESILTIIKRDQLDYVQLHGHESRKYCEQLWSQGIKILKAFAIEDNFNFDQIYKFEPFISYFLFDAKGKLPGGNGLSYNWNLLKQYNGTKSFLLSGGISLTDLEKISKFDHAQCIGVDVNSGFEMKPGLKNKKELSDFIKGLEVISK